MLNFFQINKNKELLIALYFLPFFLGWSVGFNTSFYNEFRVMQVILLLFFGLVSWVDRSFIITKIELIFFTYLVIGFFVWDQPSFVITEMLLVYLIYKNFRILNYNNSVTKIVLLSSFLLFMLLPLSLWEYINTGIYDANWYPFPWNIRVYDSCILVLSIFGTWFYISEKQHKNLYLLFLFLAFLAVLLDAGRSATLAYTVFIIIIALYCKPLKLPLILTYISSWLVYLLITYIVSSGSSSMAIARESSSGRIDLWVNGLSCWLQKPIFGCGFYQLEQFPHLSAHPHNLFIQILTEVGLVGFIFLSFIVFKIARHISWNIKQNYFVIAALFAISIDISLSGIYVYPITQMALLWLFVFLLKNSAFNHAQDFTQKRVVISYYQYILALAVYVMIAAWFVYIIIQSFGFAANMPITPPRFWGYGYLLF